MKRLLLPFLLLAAACKQPEAPKSKPAAPPAAKPTPFAPLLDTSADGGALDPRESLHEITPLEVKGPKAPEGAAQLSLNGTKVAIDGMLLDPETDAEKIKAAVGVKPVVIQPDADTYLAQVQALFSLLDSEFKPKLYLRHPDRPEIAWPIELKEESAFHDWVDEAVPGKARIIQRADGFELTTNLGKLPGGDPNGPTVPLRGGKMDLTLLQKGLDRVKRRFPNAPDACWMPSYGTTLSDLSRALAANWLAEDAWIFTGACVVYPRPGVHPSGKKPPPKEVW